MIYCPSSVGTKTPLQVSSGNKNNGPRVVTICAKSSGMTKRSAPLIKNLELIKDNLLKGYGWNVEFEKWDGYKHIDIAITKAKFNIEVEGSQHNLNPNQAFTDQLRDFYSDQKGFVTKRIPNSLLKDDMGAKKIAELIDKQLQERVEQLRK